MQDMAESKQKTPNSEISGNDRDVAIGETEPYLQELATLKADGANLMFEAQAALLNHAVQKIGMGKYQWGLFVLAGYGWLCDQVNCIHIIQVVPRIVINAEYRQLWQTTVSDALPQVGIEFNPPHSAFLSLALIAGLVIGAGFWGFGADLVGRRLVFNTTLLIAGVFGIAAGGANSFVSCAVLCSFIGFGVGGNRKFIQSVSQFVILRLSSACGRCHLPRISTLDPSVSSGNLKCLVVHRPSYSSSDGLGKTFLNYEIYIHSDIQI
jgi:hypothetical protein